jgi:hypothetical protein
MYRKYYNNIWVHYYKNRGPWQGYSTRFCGFVRNSVRRRWQIGLVVSSLLAELWAVRSSPDRVYGGSFKEILPSPKSKYR